MGFRKIVLLGHAMIMNQEETVMLNTFLKTKQYPMISAAAATAEMTSIVYGAILHNDGCTETDHKKLVGRTFIYGRDGSFEQMKIKDFHLVLTLVAGGLTFTPFAALVQTEQAICLPETEAFAAFLRIDEMDVITNLLNREYVYAIKEVVTPSRATTVSDWKRRIDDTRLIEVAMTVS